MEVVHFEHASLSAGALGDARVRSILEAWHSDHPAPIVSSGHGRSSATVDSLAVSTPPRGLLIGNPPWGLRSAGSRGEDAQGELVRKLYGRLRQLVEERFGRWALALLCMEQGHARRVSRELAPALQITAGGRKTWLMMRALAKAHGVDDAANDASGS